MTEAEKPKRRWFQFRLATAVLLMFVAGGLMWANQNEQTLYVDRQIEIYAYGWPTFVVVGRRKPDLSSPTKLAWALKTVPLLPLENALGQLQVVKSERWLLLTIDIVTSIAILVSVALMSETFIRRREAQKP